MISSCLQLLQKRNKEKRKKKRESIFPNIAKGEKYHDLSHQLRGGKRDVINIFTNQHNKVDINSTQKDQHVVQSQCHNAVSYLIHKISYFYQETNSTLLQALQDIYIPKVSCTTCKVEKALICTPHKWKRTESLQILRKMFKRKKTKTRRNRKDVVFKYISTSLRQDYTKQIS